MLVSMHGPENMMCRAEMYSHHKHHASLPPLSSEHINEYPRTSRTKNTKVHFADAIKGKEIHTCVYFHNHEPSKLLHGRVAVQTTQTHQTVSRETILKPLSNIPTATKHFQGHEKPRGRSNSLPMRQLSTWDVQFSFSPVSNFTGAMVTLVNIQYEKFTRHIHGSIVVQNLAYEKDVFVIYTTDGWKSKHNQSAHYLCSHKRPQKVESLKHNTSSTPLDLFGFSIPLEGLVFDSTRSTTTVELTIGYTILGVTHWDNNVGKNYSGCITYSSRALSNGSSLCPASDILPNKTSPFITTKTSLNTRSSSTSIPTDKPSYPGFLKPFPSLTSHKCIISRRMPNVLFNNITAAKPQENGTNDSKINDFFRNDCIAALSSSLDEEDELVALPPMFSNSFNTRRPPLVRETTSFFKQWTVECGRPRLTRSVSECQSTRSFQLFCQDN